MWSTTLLACSVLWGAWILSPLSGATLPPDLSMAQIIQMFEDFTTQYNKTYQTPEGWQELGQVTGAHSILQHLGLERLTCRPSSCQETCWRFKVFMDSLERSRTLQASERGSAQYGVTCFSDLTENEFAKRFSLNLSLLPNLPIIGRHQCKHFLLRDQVRRKSCDWRKVGAVTAVKNQVENKEFICKSCWAFAAASNIEALWNIHHHKPRNVSVQEIVDCTYNKRTGCEGGFVEDGLSYVIRNRGLSNSKMYPYAGRRQRCQKYHGREVTTIDGCEMLPRDEEYIARVVASQGPVTALLNMKLLHDYQNGVIEGDPETCNPCHQDHAVVIVGFSKESKTGPYWIIQNSWGKDWGEKGYFRLKQGANTCGIAMHAVTAVVKDSKERKSQHCPGT